MDINKDIVEKDGFLVITQGKNIDRILISDITGYGVSKRLMLKYLNYYLCGITLALIFYPNSKTDNIIVAISILYLLVLLFSFKDRFYITGSNWKVEIRIWALDKDERKWLIDKVEQIIADNKRN